MAKKFQVGYKPKTQVTRIGFTVYQKNGDYKHAIVTTPEFLNLTLSGCEEFLNDKYRNIVIDFDFEHPRFIKFAPLEVFNARKRFYVMATKFDNTIEPFLCDFVSDVLFIVNAKSDNLNRIYKRIEIVKS